MVRCGASPFLVSHTVWFVRGSFRRRGDELYPFRHSARAARCVAYLSLDQLDKAREDVAALLASDTKRPHDYYCCNVLCLALEDQALYRESCQAMLDALMGPYLPTPLAGATERLADLIERVIGMTERP